MPEWHPLHLGLYLCTYIQCKCKVTAIESTSVFFQPGLYEVHWVYLSREKKEDKKGKKKAFKLAI